MTRSRAEIDLGAIADNARALRALAPGSALCAVVKANGYGHGEAAAAQAAIDGGAEILGVARVDEGLQLRSAGFGVPIWVLSKPRPDEFAAAAQRGLEPTVYSPAGITAAISCGAEMTVHLKIDTGMHRVGAMSEDAVELGRLVDEAKNLKLGSVWTHCAVADDPTDPFTSLQLDRFDAAVSDLLNAGIDVPITHAANSGATLAWPRAHRDVIRCGISLYGLPPSLETADRIELRPALRWLSEVAFVKRLQAGDRVSYGQKTLIERPTTAATIPVGYADGYRRDLWRHPGHVLVGGQRRSILGVVTMDQMVVDCGDDSVDVGDEVVLIGEQGDQLVTATDLAEDLGTINYEIVCAISSRVERRYVNPQT